MAQAGIHGLIGMVVRRWAPKRAWLMLGIVLGSIIPDLDNLAVAVATVTKSPTEGLHRTLTHSLLMVVVLVVVGYLIGKAAKRPRWTNLGWGLGIGVILHILLDLLIWFNGVALFWPLSTWVNLWGKVTPPEGWMKLMDPAELLFFALFFGGLYLLARRRKTDGDYLKTLQIWTGAETVLFVIFTVLLYTLSKGYATIFGAVYLLSLLLAVGVTLRMRRTIEAV